ncbi:MAG: UDP-N-acetylmuramate dehydrogenase [Candidatus Levybacteria bacterium]|nr:UDP-N-acetylmuramate dehydrogenase [Candidatus Levybacteria bacterium]
MKIYQDFPLSKILYYRIGGTARYVINVQSIDDVKEALVFIKQENIPRVMPIGLGANILVNDTPFDGAILWFKKSNSRKIRLTKEGLIEAFASEMLDELIQFSFANSSVGLEWAGGLPSTIGGAIRGNVGAYGGEIKDNVVKVEVLEVAQNGVNQRIMALQDCDFSYRSSFFKKNKNVFIVAGYFSLKKGNKKDVKEARSIYASHIVERKVNHPLEYPNCGSVFKNIVETKKVAKIISVWPEVTEFSENKWHGKIAMGYVIKRLGFSGYQVGGAQVSEKHANYIINIKKARFSDVVAIIETIKRTFYQTFGFYPDTEVEIIY